MPASRNTFPIAFGLWLLALALALGLATSGWDEVFAGGSAHPVTNDSFYHLERILAIAEDPSSVHEFDAQLHWPQGTWITWPWAYDYLVGITVGLLGDDRRAAAWLAMFTPLILLAINLALVGLIARRVLPPAMAALVLLAYAAAPLTMALHTLGKIDHHAAEHTLWLLTIWLTLRWQSAPRSTSRGAALGAVLGVASAFHNGLFMIQIPVLALLFYQRFALAQPADARATRWFCAALMSAQLLVLLPSHHFHTFTYGFYYLSWFHLHVAFLTCLAALALSVPRRAVSWALLGAAVLLALPAARQALYGLGFMGAGLPGLEGITETNSPFWGDLSFRRTSNFYSGLIWLSPALAAWAAWRLLARKAALSTEPALLVLALFGLILMAVQVRFSQFGSVFLVLLPALIFQVHARAPRHLVYTAALIAGAYVQSIGAYAYQYPVGGSDRYHRGQALIKVLGRACAREPGLLLADRNWGNFLRYRTDCALIANNFIMTEQDFDAIARSGHYLSMEPDQLRRELPELRYVLASSFERNALSEALLSEASPAGFERLAEIHDRQGRVTGRAFRIFRPDAD